MTTLRPTDRSAHRRVIPTMPYHWSSFAWRCGWVLLALTLPACGDWLPRANLAPTYEPPQYVVPASWHGASPFVEAKP
ncbi:MAG TPA: hypothetical protein VFU48_11040, partial [Nitrospira sp.]|nr:hypothetical protein [Nitrospira sp.]